MDFRLTQASLKKLCRDLKLYSSAPALNDILHLQCKGIMKLENLDEYTGLKTLYLEQNAIMVIENLDALTNLRCLYLGKNMINEIGCGLSMLTNLETLDLADNYIECVDGLASLPSLRTLTLSGNKMRSLADVQHLKSCSALVSLDLANCKLAEPSVVDMVQHMPLAYLRLQGNPCVGQYRNYRKTLVARMPGLNYLDDMPVFPKDRRLAVAFQEGGLEAERSERALLGREEEQQREAHTRAFDEMVARARANPPPPHDPMRFRAVPPGESESDEEGLPPGYGSDKRRRKEHSVATATSPGAAAAAADAAAGAVADSCASSDTSAAMSTAQEVDDGAEVALGRSAGLLEAGNAGRANSVPGLGVEPVTCGASQRATGCSAEVGKSSQNPAVPRSETPNVPEPLGLAAGRASGQPVQSPAKALSTGAAKGQQRGSTGAAEPSAAAMIATSSCDWPQCADDMPHSSTSSSSNSSSNIQDLSISVQPGSALGPLRGAGFKSELERQLSSRAQARQQAAMACSSGQGASAEPNGWTLQQPLSTTSTTSTTSTAAGLNNGVSCRHGPNLIIPGASHSNTQPSHALAADITMEPEPCQGHGAGPSQAGVEAGEGGLDPPPLEVRPVGGWGGGREGLRPHRLPGSAAYRQLWEMALRVGEQQARQAGEEQQACAAAEEGEEEGLGAEGLGGARQQGERREQQLEGPLLPGLGSRAHPTLAPSLLAYAHPVPGQGVVPQGGPLGFPSPSPYPSPVPSQLGPAGPADLPLAPPSVTTPAAAAPPSSSSPLGMQADMAGQLWQGLDSAVELAAAVAAAAGTPSLPAPSPQGGSSGVRASGQQALQDSAVELSNVTLLLSARRSHAHPHPSLHATRMGLAASSASTMHGLSSGPLDGPMEERVGAAARGRDSGHAEVQQQGGRGEAGEGEGWEGEGEGEGEGQHPGREPAGLAVLDLDSARNGNPGGGESEGEETLLLLPGLPGAAAMATLLPSSHVPLTDSAHSSSFGSDLGSALGGGRASGAGRPALGSGLGRQQQQRRGRREDDSADEQEASLEGSEGVDDDDDDEEEEEEEGLGSDGEGGLGRDLFARYTVSSVGLGAGTGAGGAPAAGSSPTPGSRPTHPAPTAPAPPSSSSPALPSMPIAAAGRQPASTPLQAAGRVPDLLFHPLHPNLPSHPPPDTSSAPAAAPPHPARRTPFTPLAVIITSGAGAWGEEEPGPLLDSAGELCPAPTLQAEGPEAGGGLQGEVAGQGAGRQRLGAEGGSLGAAGSSSGGGMVGAHRLVADAMLREDSAFALLAGGSSDTGVQGGQGSGAAAGLSRLSPLGQPPAAAAAAAAAPTPAGHAVGGVAAASVNSTAEQRLGAGLGPPSLSPAQPERISPTAAAAAPAPAPGALPAAHAQSSAAAAAAAAAAPASASTAAASCGGELLGAHSMGQGGPAVWSTAQQRPLSSPQLQPPQPRLAWQAHTQTQGQGQGQGQQAALTHDVIRTASSSSCGATPAGQGTFGPALPSHSNPTPTSLHPLGVTQPSHPTPSAATTPLPTGAAPPHAASTSREPYLNSFSPFHPSPSHFFMTDSFMQHGTVPPSPFEGTPSDTLTRARAVVAAANAAEAAAAAGPRGSRPPDPLCPWSSGPSSCPWPLSGVSAWAGSGSSSSLRAGQSPGRQVAGQGDISGRALASQPCSLADSYVMLAGVTHNRTSLELARAVVRGAGGGSACAMRTDTQGGETGAGPERSSRGVLSSSRQGGGAGEAGGEAMGQAGPSRVRACVSCSGSWELGGGTGEEVVGSVREASVSTQPQAPHTAAAAAGEAGGGVRPGRQHGAMQGVTEVWGAGDQDARGSGGSRGSQGFRGGTAAGDPVLLSPHSSRSHHLVRQDSATEPGLRFMTPDEQDPPTPVGAAAATATAAAGGHRGSSGAGGSGGGSGRDVAEEARGPVRDVLHELD